MSDTNSNPETRIALFQRKEVRRTIHNNEWWFVVVDVVAALTDAADPTDYLNKIRRRDLELAKGYGQIVHPFSYRTLKRRERLNIIHIFDERFRPIPKGLCPPAQGCEARATLGKRVETGVNPKGVVAPDADNQAATPLGLARCDTINPG